MFAKKHKSLNENGFASIVIALILIIVLALLTVGFAQLARREQQDALDKQLASQAFDAAESGVNNAYADIQNNLITASTPNEGGSKCIAGTDVPSTAQSYKYDSSKSIDANHGVSYSCLLVNLNPPALEKGLSTGSAWTTIFKVVGSDGSDRALKSFDITWSSTQADHTALPPAGSQFQPIGTGSGNWGKSPALLAVSITPLGTAAAPHIDRNSLIDDSLTAYLRPSSTAGSLTYPAGAIQSPTNPYSGNADGSGGQGQIIQAKCTSGSCKVTVNMSSGIGGQTGGQYLIHIVDYYDDSNISLKNPVDASGPVNFANSQAVIDVTGKARQVLKRIQTYVPLKPPIPLPSYGLEGEDLCKRFNTTIDTLPDGSPGGTASDTGGISDPNGACNLN